MNLRTTPESTFLTAQQAMARGDLDAFFACLDRDDLLKIGRSGVPTEGRADTARWALCLDHGVPVELLDKLAEAVRESLDSAQGMLTGIPSTGNPADLQQFLQASNRHRDLVKAVGQAVDACLKSVKDLVAFTAQAERLHQATHGGGTISSTMLVDERLSDVRIEGTKASGIRHHRGGSTQLIGFVARKGVWYIKLSGGLTRTRAQIEPARPATLPESSAALLLRTDFSDAAAWKRLCAAIRSAPSRDSTAYQANMEFIDDKSYAGIAPQSLQGLLPKGSHRTFLFVADSLALSHPEQPVLVVDLADEPGRSFRALPSQLGSIDANLSLANMLFEEFAGSADGDGVFRGFGA